MNIIKKILNKAFQRRNNFGQPLYRSGWNSFDSSPSITWASSYSDGVTQEVYEKAPHNPTRKVAKPVDVFNEIISEEPAMELGDLDNKIKIVKERMKLLKEHLGKRVSDFADEREALEFLKARKKYNKSKELFKWAVTTHELINKLLSEYELRMVNIEGYYRTLPSEALEELSKYVKAFGKIRDDEPIFQLIIDQGGAEEKKDPILLAGSPFGNWFYVLGAWDKEVEVVDKIIYERK